MNAYSRTFAEDRAEVVGRGRFFISPGGEAEVVVAFAELTEPRQIVDEQEDFGAVGSVGLASTLDLGGDRREPGCGVSKRTDLDGVGEQSSQSREELGLGMILGSAVENGEPRSDATGLG